MIGTIKCGIKLGIIACVAMTTYAIGNALIASTIKTVIKKCDDKIDEKIEIIDDKEE